MTGAIWTGYLAKGDAPGTVIGRLTDAWGYFVDIRGERQPDGTYKLLGTLGIPDDLKVQAIDGEVTRTSDGVELVAYEGAEPEISPEYRVPAIDGDGG